MEHLYIIKIGGNVIDDDDKLAGFLDDFATIEGYKILVHGGGRLTTTLAERLGIKQQLVDGRRITDADTLRIAVMVYAGYINKTIVSLLQARGCNAIGLTGADGNLLFAHRRDHPEIDYGFVGDIDTVNSILINEFLDDGYTLVVAPLTHDGHGQLLNTNADTVAREIAIALSSEHEVSLIYTFEKRGVLLDLNDENSMVKQLTHPEYKMLRKQEKIGSGMIPKLDNAFASLKAGVKKVSIGSSEDLKDLIKGQAGTSLLNE